MAGGLAAQMVVFFLMWGRDWMERKLWGNQGASRSSTSGKQKYQPVYRPESEDGTQLVEATHPVAATSSECNIIA